MSNNTTTSNATKSATSAKKFAFTFDHINKKIVGKDVDFQKAGIPGSALEAELTARMEARPDYTFAVLETEKKPAKQTYKGLTMEVMEAYLAIYNGELAVEMRAKFEEMKGKHESYPFIKSWFLDQFPRFNVSKAKTAIKAKKLETAKAPYRVIRVSVGVPQSANK